MVKIRQNRSKRISCFPAKKLCCFGFLITVVLSTIIVLSNEKKNVFLTADHLLHTTTTKDCFSSKNENENIEVDPTIYPVRHAWQLAQQKELDDEDKFRVLYIVSTLTEYDTGGRGTQKGKDRLKDVVIPTLVESIQRMKNWQVDVYLILGYEKLLPERFQLIRDALPTSIVKNIFVWEDSIPYFYSDRRRRGRGASQTVELAMHGLSRQHRFVLKDELHNYDFFMAFEDDMKVTHDHVLNFLELSTMIETLTHDADSIEEEYTFNQGIQRDKSHDGAKVGNDVAYSVADMKKNQYQRLFPGFLRVEVDIQHSNPNNGGLANVRKSFPQSQFITPFPETPELSMDYCCSSSTSSDTKNVFMWETNVQASGVRKYPEPLGWVATMPVQDISDVGSYWSGYNNVFKDGNPKRPRRVDATLGQQAGFMATRSQIEFFDKICPGGFLPPFISDYWKGNSLKRHSVEFWSGGFQLFGTCHLNRILSLDPNRFSKQLLHHTSNNKQHTKQSRLIYHIQDYYGQLYTVKQSAMDWLKEHTTNNSEK